MYLPNLKKKLPREGKNFTFVTPKFSKFNRQKLEVPKSFRPKSSTLRDTWPEENFVQGQDLPVMTIMEARTINQ